MNMKRLIIALAGTLLAGSVAAQTASQPLNLKLPPGDVPASSSTAAAPASSSSIANSTASKPAPGVYYGDTSGRMGNTERDTASTHQCDDSTYNQAQTHGSVGMGVVGGNHVSGSYQTASVDVTKNLGDCDHPTGSVGFSINVGQGNFHGGHGY
ncbi:hypothetical protein [Rhodanobacter sp. C01]|uniref:hypothetical protein n=1 Tax=Rhodanobacter sp. C01 TaxID=1945856 RepID=UPI00098689AB|nr:hypothetical protein [Rhodanobacter sp. C01]OOG47992.1 hypothetical protein B0E50_11285 [Rhodanobacter sp. C01]